MTTYLLDADVLIALTVAEHEHHERASRWAADIESFALCPVVEGALIRYLVRLGTGAGHAVQVLRAVQELPTYRFWPDAVSYARVDLSGVRGHRQVTDAYLVSLVGAHPGAALATLDQDLAKTSPELTLLLP